MSLIDCLTAAAGVSLHVPRRVYELHVAKVGDIALRRGKQSLSARNGLLALRVGNGGGPPHTVHFELRSWGSSHGLPRSDEQQHAPAWRDLIVEYHVLSQPQWLLSKGPKDPLPADAGAALDALRERLRAFLRCEKKPWLRRRCMECTAKASKHVPRARARGMRPDPQEDPWCEHVPLAHTALVRLCEAFPELAFEFIEWLVPAAARAADGQLPTEPPSRFVLTPTVMRAVVGAWCLGAHSTAWRRHRYNSYERHDKNRQVYRTGKMRDLSALPRASAAQQGALMFAARGWGMDESMEDMVADWGRSAQVSPEYKKTKLP